MDIYELLNRIIKNEKYSLSANLFVEKHKATLAEKDIILFDLLKNIASLETKIHNSGITFHSTFVMADGRRNFSVEDITDNDYDMLERLKLEKIPAIFRARIADILWTQKKVYLMSKIAAEAYWELFQLWYSKSEHVGTLDPIRRAVCITKQTGNIELYDKICQWFEGFLNSNPEEEGFFLLRVMELFSEQKDYDVARFLPVLDSFINFHNADVSKVEQAYKLKTQCLNKMKKKELALRNNISLANFYVQFAEETVGKNILGAMRSSGYFQKAITLYRNNGETEKAEITHKRLVEVQKDIPKAMIPISMELDIGGIIDNVKTNMLGLTFEECIMRLAQTVVFEKRNDIKQRVIKKHIEYPLAHLWGENLINSSGQTILALPPLDIENLEKNPQLLELHMHRDVLEKQRISGDIWIKNVLFYIRKWSYVKI